jgi:hypothetical protein
MTFKEYITSLQEYLNTHPEAASYTVLTASDDEGNSFSEDIFDVSRGLWEDGEWQCEENLPCDITHEYNSICVN